MIIQSIVAGVQARPAAYSPSTTTAPTGGSTATRLSSAASGARLPQVRGRQVIA
ncbi:hypothetical protein [Amycolatopsis sp. Hca4]|uniref:hypothetical protein n=1 Tax=Amycolatopsis sp. Hca4 TaxID=2742131 RepID=UPI0015915D8F|nr:hypothetical protein [Amycolatopsis sp. Hca4]QKV72467.1 hypothetical protein HUT10_00385 [Amycolatopsis sp. Hca4]